MILGISYVYLLSFVCTSGEFLDIGHRELEVPIIYLIGKFKGSKDALFYVFNVIMPGLTQALCFRYDVMRHLKLEQGRQLGRLGNTEE